MKKVLLIALAFVLVLALGAGCNNSGGGDDSGGLGEITAGGGDTTGGGDTGSNNSGGNDDDFDFDNDDAGSFINTADWPESLPAYTDGDVKSVQLTSSGAYQISIGNTSKAAFEKYCDTLAKGGWKSAGDTSGGSSALFEKEKLSALMILDGDGASLSIRLSELAASEYETLPSAWPAALLPSGLPEYTDGEISNVVKSDKGTVGITISGSSGSALDAYKATVEKAGWEFSEKTSTGFWYGKKDGRDLILGYGESTGNVTIDFM